jgi:hypothetical protein
MQSIRRGEIGEVQLPEGCGYGQWDSEPVKITNIHIVFEDDIGFWFGLIGGRKMSRRTTIVSGLGFVLTGVMLCAIFASELPELLSLTNNTSNDFTIACADWLVSPVLNSARIVLKAAVKFNNSSQDPLFGHIGTPEKTDFCPSLFFIRYSVRRT